MKACAELSEHNMPLELCTLKDKQLLILPPRTAKGVLADYDICLALLAKLHPSPVSWKLDRRSIPPKKTSTGHKRK